MLMCRRIIIMNVTNSLISLAIFCSNLPQSKYETGFSIGYPFRELTNSCVCVCVLNMEFSIKLFSTQTSLQQKHSTNVISKRLHYVGNIMKLTSLSTGAEYGKAIYIGCKVNRLPTCSHETIITSQTESQFPLRTSQFLLRTSQFPLRTSTNDTVTKEQLKIKFCIHASVHRHSTLTRSNKMQLMQVFIYCKIILHVSGVYRTHHHEYIKL